MPGFSDGLGEAFFDVAVGTFGTFEISLGPGPSLFDGVSPVSFDNKVFHVQVTPEPGSLGILGGLYLFLRGRRVARSRVRRVVGDPGRRS